MARHFPASPAEWARVASSSRHRLQSTAPHRPALAVCVAGKTSLPGAAGNVMATANTPDLSAAIHAALPCNGRNACAFAHGGDLPTRRRFRHHGSNPGGDGNGQRHGGRTAAAMAHLEMSDMARAGRGLRFHHHHMRMCRTHRHHVNSTVFRRGKEPAGIATAHVKPPRILCSQPVLACLRPISAGVAGSISTPGRKFNPHAAPAPAAWRACVCRERRCMPRKPRRRGNIALGFAQRLLDVFPLQARPAAASCPASSGVVSSSSASARRMASAVTGLAR